MNTPYYPTPAVAVAPTVRVQGEPAFGDRYNETLLAAMASDATHNGRRHGMAVLIEVTP